MTTSPLPPVALKVNKRNKMDALESDLSGAGAGEEGEAEGNTERLREITFLLRREEGHDEEV